MGLLYPTRYIYKLLYSLYVERASSKTPKKIQKEGKNKEGKNKENKYHRQRRSLNFVDLNIVLGGGLIFIVFFGVGGNLSLILGLFCLLAFFYSHEKLVRKADL